MDRLEIACPNCGQKRRVGGRELETKRKIEIACAGCGNRFVVSNTVPDALAKMAKSLKDRLGKIKF